MNRVKEFFELLRSKITTGSISELSWVFLGHLLNVLLGFVILKILSQMGTKDYGIYALVITVSSLLGLTFYGPLVQGFIRFYYDYLERKAIHHYLRFVYRIILITGSIHILVSLAAVLFSAFVDLELGPAAVLFAGVYILSLRIGEFFNSFLSIIRKRKENSLLQGGEKLLLTILLFILLDTGGLYLLPVFIILTIASVVFTFIKIAVFKSFVPPAEDNDSFSYSTLKPEISKKLTTYIMPFLIWGITAWLQLNGEKWIIAGILSTSDVGIYAVMISLITALVIFPANILAEFTTPIIFQNYTDLTNKPKVNLGYTYIRINMFLVLAITIIATLVTAFWGKEFIILISNTRYAVYSNLLPFLCAGTGLFYTGQALSSLGLSLNQPGKYLFPKILTGILSILLNYYLIKSVGIAGTAYNALIIGFIYLAYIALVNMNIIKSMKAAI
jgi:O-antigen/teichoic acid export membrane protein